MCGHVGIRYSFTTGQTLLKQGHLLAGEDSAALPGDVQIFVLDFDDDFVVHVFPFSGTSIRCSYYKPEDTKSRSYAEMWDSFRGSPCNKIREVVAKQQ
jgi:hypothetical protein